jgi:predicted transposase YdaD
MSDSPHQPHDKLFKLGFSDPANAAAFLRTQIEPAVAEAIDWASLRLQAGSFIDNHLIGSESDLLFAATLEGAPCGIYLLFEHQTTEDRWIALRLLRYLVRIWETHQRENPALPLPVVVPVVLAQDARVWDLPETFGALVGQPGALRPQLRRYVPDFRFHLIQLAALPFERLLGTPKGIITLRVLKAERVGDTLGGAIWDEALLGQLDNAFIAALCRYLLSTGTVDPTAFRDRIHKLSEPRIRDQAMTTAEQLRREGRLEGRHEGLQEGRLAALHDYILEALQVRFGEVPESARESVSEISDEARLRELLRAAIRTPTLDAFVDGLAGFARPEDGRR